METRQELNTEIPIGPLVDIPAEIRDEIAKFFVKSDYRFFHSVCHSFYDPKADELHKEYLKIVSKRIVTNGHSIFFIQKKGQLLALGDNWYGQLGLGSNDRCKTPTLIHLNEVHSVVAMALGRCHSLLLTDKGEVLTCGDNSIGQLGLGDSNALSTFVKVNLDTVLTKDEHIVLVEVSDFSNLLLTNKGRVLACGNNNDSSLGLSEEQYHTFTLVDLSNVLQNEEIIVAMTSCYNNSLLLTDKGQVLISGREDIGSYNKFTLAELNHVLDKNETIVALSASNSHNLLLTNKGQVLTRGSNTFGQLGLGDAMSQKEFKRIDLSPVLQKNEIIVAVVSNVNRYSILLTDRGRVLVCGKNYNDRFGFGHDKNVCLFSEMDLSAILEKNESIVTIKPGDNDLLITDKARVIAWGRNHFAGNKKDLFTELNVDFFIPKEESSHSNCMTNSL